MVQDMDEDRGTVLPPLPVMVEDSTYTSTGWRRITHSR
jgi:hypothetical protein